MLPPPRSAPARLNAILLLVPLAKGRAPNAPTGFLVSRPKVLEEVTGTCVKKICAGRVWPSTDVMHPVEEVPRGTRHAAVLRAAVLCSRLDVAAVYLGLASRTIEPA